MTPNRSKTYTNLQKTYDQCFLTCNTAAYYESQGNEPEALRCWRECLAQIQHYNAYSRNSGAFRSTRSRSETEKVLDNSLRTMELQCQERVDLLETLKLSRIEGPRATQSQTGQSQAERPGSSRRQTEGHLSSASGPTKPVVYVSSTRSSDIRPPLPQRPSQSRQVWAPQRSATAPGGGSLSPYPPMQSVVYPKLGRTPSPDKRTAFLTTLRTKKPMRQSQLIPNGTPGTAAKAAGLAWGSVPRGIEGTEFVRTGLAESTMLIKELQSQPNTSQPCPAIDHLATQFVAMPDPQMFCPLPEHVRPSEDRVSRPRARSTTVQPERASRPPQVPEHMVPPAVATTFPIDPSSRFLGGTNSEPSPEKMERRLSELSLNQTSLPLSDKPHHVSKEAQLRRNSLDCESNPTGLVRNCIHRKPVPTSSAMERAGSNSSYSSQESYGGYTPTDDGEGDDEGGIEQEEKGQEVERVSGKREENDIGQKSTTRLTPLGLLHYDEAKTWEERVYQALKHLDKGVDTEAVNQIINEIVVKGDEVHWDDVAGLEVAKMALKEAVVYPFLRPDLFRGLREPARGMLLFGPPGTGKTMIARAVATESKSTFFSISASSLTSKYLGESEKLVRALFALAKALAPSIIFVDEIDSLLSTRGSGEHEATRRLKTEFLIQWSSLQNAAAGKDPSSTHGDPSRVLVLAATNLPWAIDEAARRRFVRRQYIPLPESETRKIQFLKLLTHHNHALSEDDLDRLVDFTDGFSGSDITALAKDAAMGPLRCLGDKMLDMRADQVRPVEMEDFVMSLRSIRPSVSKQGLAEFENWAKEFGERV